MSRTEPQGSSTADSPFDAVVIGAGISGLTTAFWLALGNRRVVVLEAAERVGGAITTWRQDGWIFELGPNTVLESRKAVTDLIRDAHLGERRIEAAPAGSRRYIWSQETLEPLPSGPPGFLKTSLFPLSAKLRLLREPWIPRAPEEVEESIAQFVRRRLGQPFLDYAVGPFVSGVYAGDPERLSVRWATPRIAELERRHGSLIRGALAKRKGPAPGGSMISFEDGLDELPRRLAETIGDVRTGTAARSLWRKGDGFEIATDRGTLKARQVVLATPPRAAGEILAEASDGLSRPLGEVPHAPVAVVGLGLRREDVRHPLDGFGFLAPRRETLRILGCLFTSSLFPGRAPEDHVALSVFAGGRTDPEIVGWDDERLLGQVLEDLDRALGISGDPALTRLRRWQPAIPQYEIGHGRFVELARQLERDLPGLHLAGNYLSGVSVPDCIESATKVACDILAC